ncbi:hypothetical protein [uncultured Tessaracoccus sp.]|uniref:hypothetical protein n=1 Tax=uncultured Tessaracoccus sp. TaxID=905023 RepID=UPI0025FB7E85|nr:hypothetical protein [uncultured Tessaracoccus sp.]
MSEATLTAGMLGDLPGTMLGIVRDKALDAGVLSKLSPEKPTIFGPVKGATFSGVPRAKIVGESEAKPGAAKPTITPWKAEPLKIVTQQRTSDEFMWADTAALAPCGQESQGESRETVDTFDQTELGSGTP